MKRYLYLLIVVTGLASLILMSCGDNKVETFGKDFKVEDVKPIDTILKEKSKLDGKVIQVAGTTKEVCPTMGCWFYIEDDTKKRLYIDVEMNKFFAVDGIDKDQNLIIEGKIVSDDNKPGGIKVIATGVKRK